MDNTSKLAGNPTSTSSAQLLVPEGDLSGKTLGDFRILRCLGQGGMGQVYLAEQMSLRRPVALKILKSEFAFDSTSLKRLQGRSRSGRSGNTRKHRPGVCVWRDERLVLHGDGVC